jgi:hypothetical protein
LAHSIPARLSQVYTAAAGRKFGFTVGVAFGVIAVIAWWRGHPIPATGLGALGGALILAGLVIPTTLGPVERSWMKLALLISKVTTPVFMGVIYFVVLTPVGVVRRIFGANALVHRGGAHGVWFDRTATGRSSLERLF